MTKTPDNNWWDGYFGGRRGFIPVSYVEVTELKPSPSPVTPQPATPTAGQSSGALFIPAPPQRKSSMPLGDGEGLAGAKASELSQDEPLLEEPEDGAPTPVPGVEEGVTSPTAVIEPTTKAFGDTQQLASVAKETDPQPEASTAEDSLADLPPRGRVGSTVKSLTKQFQDPDPAPKVLVEPHHSSQHKRQLSDHKSSIPGDAGELPGPVPPRSASGSGKVSMLSSTFENKAATSAPPPIKPKPGSLSTAAPGEVFPLVHNTNLGVSPLQMAALQGQHPSKPAVASKKPTVAAAATKASSKPSKSSVKSKKKESSKEKEKGKPAPNPKPGFGANPVELQAELQARVKRKQSEDIMK